MKTIKLAVFDLGGTVIEDVGHVPAAFQAALGQHGYSASDTEISRWRGASKREVVRHIVGSRESRDDGISERVYRTFQERLIELFKEHGARPVEGLEEAFARLREAGVRIAITTGFDRVVTEQVLAGIDRQQTFDAIVCGDDVSAGRPAPYMIFRAMEIVGELSVHRVAKVGDTTNDLRAGYYGGVAVNIGVLTGAHGEDELRQVPHTHILESAAQVPGVLAADTTS